MNYTPEEIENGRKAYIGFFASFGAEGGASLQWESLNKKDRKAWIEAAKACQPEGDMEEYFAVEELMEFMHHCEWRDDSNDKYASLSDAKHDAERLAEIRISEGYSRNVRVVKIVQFKTVVKE